MYRIILDYLREIGEKCKKNLYNFNTILTYSLNKGVLAFINYYGLGAGDSATNKTEEHICPFEACYAEWVNKQINKCRICSRKC